MEGPQPVYRLERFRGTTGLALACSTVGLWNAVSCYADAVLSIIAVFLESECFLLCWVDVLTDPSRIIVANCVFDHVSSSIYSQFCFLHA